MKRGVIDGSEIGVCIVVVLTGRLLGRPPALLLRLRPGPRLLLRILRLRVFCTRSVVGIVTVDADAGTGVTGGVSGILVVEVRLIRRRSSASRPMPYCIS